MLDGHNFYDSRGLLQKVVVCIWNICFKKLIDLQKIALTQAIFELENCYFYLLRHIGISLS